mgnify:FL=1
MFDKNNNYSTELAHVDGEHNLEIAIEGDQAVIRFGSSFTLRMNETQVDALRDILYEAARHMALVRPIVDVEYPGFTAVEDYFIDQGIKASETIKAMRNIRQDRQISCDDFDRDDWDANDPRNW